jgi:hypothetical protein
MRRIRDLVSVNKVKGVTVSAVPCELPGRRLSGWPRIAAARIVDGQS